MSKAPVAIIGLGLMGEVYAQRLLDAGIAVSGFDIDPARRARLKEIGGQPAETIAELCLLYTSPSPRDGLLSRMPSSA